ncbi:MAG: hypothetical protein FWD78_05825 [Treponema sp.]|nr:hypothetical protein [Treponema sp.]
MKVLSKGSTVASDLKFIMSSLCKARNLVFLLFLILPTIFIACPVTTTTPVYKVGEKGPAGGIVFYDKGVYSDTNYSLGDKDYTINWRYMEAAPAAAEFEAFWGPQDFNVESTDASLLTFANVGNGKRNTQIIVDSFTDGGLSGADYAAQQCLDLTIGGYNNWFLPSNDELGFMYTNLKTLKLGGFSDSIYWSSTQQDKDYAHARNFSNGDYATNYPKDGVKHLVRAARYF